LDSLQYQIDSKTGVQTSTNLYQRTNAKPDGLRFIAGTVTTVQTFMPYADFYATAAVLDYRRLGKQRVETLQILKALTVPGYGWANHPAVVMWRGYERSLVAYGLAICDEWLRRGYKDSVRAQLVRVEAALHSGDSRPPWLGREDVHRSHRSNLVRKDPSWYSARFEVGLPDDLDYVWPSRE
jgi:hypothetical protein